MAIGPVLQMKRGSVGQLEEKALDANFPMCMGMTRRINKAT